MSTRAAARRASAPTSVFARVRWAISSYANSRATRPGFVAREVWAASRRHLGTAVAIVVTATLALAMLGGALLLRAQIGEVKGAWYDTTQVAVYLAHDTTDDQVEALGVALDSNKLVQRTWFEDQELAYANFAHQFRNTPELVSEVSPDQMPRSYRIKLNDPADGDELVAQMSALPGVRQVVDEHAQLSTLFGVLSGFQTAALLLAAIQALAAVVLISNMVRSTLVVRAKELEIGRVMGASRPQLGLPFLAEVAAQGLLGALAATALLVVAKHELIDQRLANSGVLSGIIGYVGWDAVWGALPWLLLAGVGFPVAVTAFLLRRHLAS